MSEKLLCLFLTTVLIMVTTLNFFVLNYLHNASKTDPEKFENVVHISAGTLKTGRIASIVILMTAFFVLFVFSKDLMANV